MQDHLHPGTELSIHELREVQLAVLEKIDAFCRAAGITYYLGWGTLLGAVRHGGYIPWDDDIDLVMMRADYEALERQFPGSAQGGDLAVRTSSNTPEWPYPFMKVCDASTLVIGDLKTPIPIGVNVDIFPVDGLPESGLRAGLQMREIKLVRRLWALRTMTPRVGRARTKQAVLWFAKLFLGKSRVSILVKRWEKSAQRFPAEGAERVGMRSGPVDWTVDRRALGGPVDIVFEGRTFWGPAEPDSVLETIYGDYMRLPPVDKQVTHHRFKAYRIDPAAGPPAAQSGP